MHSVQRAARELLSLHGSLHHLKQQASQTWLNKMHVMLGTVDERIASRRQELQQAQYEQFFNDFAEVWAMHMKQIIRR